MSSGRKRSRNDRLHTIMGVRKIPKHSFMLCKRYGGELFFERWSEGVVAFEAGWCLFYPSKSRFERDCKLIEVQLVRQVDVAQLPSLDGDIPDFIKRFDLEDRVAFECEGLNGIFVLKDYVQSLFRLIDEDKKHNVNQQLISDMFHRIH